MESTLDTTLGSPTTNYNDNFYTAAFHRIKHLVCEEKRVLKEIIAKQGAKNLYDYAKGYIEVNVNPPIESRQSEFLCTFHDEVEKRLGTEIAVSATSQLKKYYYVSTADHHGPICTPFFLTSNIIASAPYNENGDPLLSNVIVLACANVSLNNSSFPRGLIFHGDMQKEHQLHQLSFFPASCRLCPVYNFHSYDQKDLIRAADVIKEKIQQLELSSERGQALLHILEEVYAEESVLGAENFSDQVTKTNHALWKRFFSPSPTQQPNLIYLEQESLVARLICKYHLTQDTVISRMIFDPEFESFIIRYFEGITGAFSRTENWGTYLFWALPRGQKYRLQVWKHGNHLVSSDGSYHLELTPDSLREALESKELIPSMLCTFLVLSLYYGVKCLGGFSQVNYLTYMKNAYIKMMADIGDYKSIEVCARVQTKELCGDVALAFLKTLSGELSPATGIDLVLYHDAQTFPSLVELSKSISLEEALNPMMAEFYKIIVPEHLRDPLLSSVTAEDITRLTGLSKKIRPCLSL